MFTSYFGNLKLVSNPLSISSRAPEWYTGPQFKLLAPKVDFLLAYKRGEIGPSEYTVLFKSKVLDLLNPVEIYQSLIKDYGDDVTLLCYEVPDEFCHRRLVADWMSKANNVEIPELRKSRLLEY